MLEILACVLLSVLSAFGLAILFVEKRDNGPVWVIYNIIEAITYRIDYHILAYVNALLGVNWIRLQKVLDVFECSVCLSVWTALIADLVIRYFIFPTYFFWPFSGFIAAGLTWIIYEFFGTLDKLRPQPPEEGLE